MNGPLRVAPTTPLPRHTLVIGVGALALIIGIALAALIHGTVASAVPTIPPPTIPPCDPAADQISFVQSQMTLGRWNVARWNAETLMGKPRLCAADRAKAANLAVAAGLEDLYSRPFDGRDVSGQRQMVDDYRSLQRFAKDNSIDFPAATQVALRSYDKGQFLLSKTAFEDGYLAGEYQASDTTILTKYDAAVFNLGMWWAQGTGETRAQGLRLLSLSHRLDTTYRLGSGAAWGELRRILGTDETQWPEPAPSPLLGPDRVGTAS